MTEVSAAATPKGERRRYALITAAAELLNASGFDAVSHRAVARRAGLPLASTTYYFTSLEELIEAAIEHIGSQEVAALRNRLHDVPRRRRGADATADLLLELLAGEPTSDQLVCRYERYIACARHPELRAVEQRLQQQRVAAVAEAVARSGRSARLDVVTALVRAVDGAVISSLVSGDADPRHGARVTLIDVIDTLAPIDSRSSGWTSVA